MIDKDPDRQHIMSEIATETTRLIQNMILPLDETLNISQYRIHASLKEYIKDSWSKRYHEENSRMETKQLSHPGLTYDIDTTSSTDEIESRDINDESIHIIICPPESKNQISTKKSRSLDVLNAKLSDMLYKQLESRKALKKDILITNPMNHKDIKESDIESDNHSIEYTSDQEDNNIESSDDSIDDEIITREKPAFATRIVDSDNENIEAQHYEDSLLDLLSGQFTKSKYVDVEADEEDSFGQIITSNDNEEERIAMEKKWIEEANEILAKGKDELMIPNDEDNIVIRELYQQQHIEEDRQDTIAILEHLNYKRRDREDERQLYAIRKKRQVVEKQDSKQDIVSFKHDQIEEHNDNIEDEEYTQKNSEFKQWRIENQKQSRFNFFEFKNTRLVKSTDTSDAIIVEPNHHKLFLQSFNVQRLNKFNELSLEKEKQVATFKKLS